MTNNPLVKYYTDPKTYVKLPTGGNYYTEKPELSVDGEVGVLAMTAVDEMMFQSPDNLLNGESLFKVIARCVPAIKNPREIPTPDLDAILVGMRIATYGNELETNANCPQCNHENNYSISLPVLLANMKMLEDQTDVQLNNDITLKIKPFTVASSVSLALYAVEIGQMQRQLAGQGEIDEEAAMHAIQTTMSKSSERLVELIAQSVVEVKIQEDESDPIIVTDAKQIKEWIEVITVSEYKEIRKQIDAISSTGIEKSMHARCTECGHEWDVQIGVDPASFFDMR